MARSPKKRAVVEYASPAARPSVSPRAPTRRTLLIACAVLCTSVMFAYAREGWASVLLRLLTDGVLCVLWLACACGAGLALLHLLPVADDDADHPNPQDHSYILKNVRMSGLEVVTAVALGLGVFSLAALGLGLAGWLNRGSAIGLLAAGALSGGIFAARRLRDTRRSSISAWLDAPATWEWLWLAPMPLLGMAVVAALLPPGVMWPGEPHGYDVVEYHLQIPREWYELGRIVPLRHNAFSFFPFNVEMHYLLAMHLRGGPWAGMYLAHFMHLAMIVLTVAAIHGFARHLAPSRAGATIAAVCVASVPWMTQLGSIAYNEGGLLLFGTLTMGWAFRAAVEPSRRLGRFPVAGLLAGFACGSKLTAVPEVLVAVGIIATAAILLTALTRRGRSEAEPRIDSDQPLDPKTIRNSDERHLRVVNDVPLVLRLLGVATFFLCGVLAFAPWLIRNQIWAGNPVFPEAADLFGQAHFSVAQVQRWRDAHSPRPDQRSLPARPKAWSRDVWASPQYGFLLLPAGCVAAIITVLSRFGTVSRYARVLKNTGIAAGALLAMFTALSVVWLGFTHLQGRFFIFGVAIAGLGLALMPWGRGVAAGGVLAVVASAVGAAVVHQPLAERLMERKLTMLLGFEDLGSALAPQILENVPDGSAVALAGDARAFVYPGPMNHLTYRTVFDVDAQPGESVIDAWTRGAPPGAWVLVDPSELARFNRTYYAIQPVPPEHRDRDEPFLIPP